MAKFILFYRDREKSQENEFFTRSVKSQGISILVRERTSDGGNRSHNVSLPIILKKTKVGQIVQYSCISLLLVPILLYWIQVSVSLNVLLYFGAELATFCIKHIENRKIFF